MNKYKRLINNSIIFAIGNLGSKLIGLLLVPLYTYYLSKEEFGTADLITTSVMMLLPLISLSLFEAVFRFSMDKKISKDAILTNAFTFTLVGYLFFLCLYPIINLISIFQGITHLLYLFLFFQMIQVLFSQFVRGIGKVKLFAVNGVIIAVLILVFNLLFLVVFELGLIGYLYSFIIANIVSIIILFFASKIKSYVNFKVIKFGFLKKMLVYSLPLMPNSMMWWVMTASDRYMILLFAGASANGLYAVATKFPSVLVVLNQIFFQAWQMSAVEEFESEKKSEFYSIVFRYFSLVMFLGASFLILLSKPIVELVIAYEFHDAWTFIPFLVLGVVFQSFSAFLGTNYIAAKKTAGVFRTTVIGAIVNIILNFLLIPFIGAIGASISMFLSFFITWLIRVFDTKKFVQIDLKYFRFILNMFLLVFQSIMLIFNPNIIFQVIFLVILMCVNYKDLTQLLVLFLLKLKVKILKN